MPQLLRLPMWFQQARNGTVLEVREHPDDDKTQESTKLFIESEVAGLLPGQRLRLKRSQVSFDSFELGDVIGQGGQGTQATSATRRRQGRRT